MEHKAIGVVEIRFARRVSQSPVTDAAIDILKNGGEVHLAGNGVGQCQLDCELQAVIGCGRHDRRWRNVERRHAFAVAGESISRPFGRRGEVEFLIAFAAPDEGLEAGVAPEAVPSARLSGRGNSDAVNGTLERVTDNEVMTGALDPR